MGSRGYGGTFAERDTVPWTRCRPALTPPDLKKAFTKCPMHGPTIIHSRTPPASTARHHQHPRHGPAISYRMALPSSTVWPCYHPHHDHAMALLSFTALPVSVVWYYDIWLHHLPKDMLMKCCFCWGGGVQRGKTDLRVSDLATNFRPYGLGLDSHRRPSKNSSIRKWTLYGTPPPPAPPHLAECCIGRVVGAFSRMFGFYHRNGGG